MNEIVDFLVPVQWRRHQGQTLRQRWFVDRMSGDDDARRTLAN